MVTIRLLRALLALALVAAACSGSNDAGTSPASTAAGSAAATTEAPSASPETSDGGEAGPGEAASYAGTEPAPEFPSGLDWLNTGRPLTVAELAGKVVVLDFWTYGCINCIHIIPDLKRLEAEYPDELVVIGVHSAKFAQEGATDNIRQVVLRYDLEHPVVNDRDFEVWRTWGAQAWPTVAVIDPAGNVVGGHSGEGVYPVLQPVIDSLVAEFDDGRLDRSPLDLAREAEGLPQTILSFPGKVHADPGADRLFIADTNHHRIVVARISDGEVTAVYGTGHADYRDGPGTGAAFSSPQGLGLSPDGTVLYVADTGNHAVRAIDLEAGEVTTVLGTGRQGRYPPVGGPGPETAVRSPWDLTVDDATMYVAMAGSHQIWTLDLESGRAEPFAGNGAESTRNGPRLEAELAQPSGVARDAADNLYFADSESSAIRVARGLDDEGTVDIVVGTDQDLFTFGDVDGTGTEALLQHPLGVSVYDGLVYVADTYNSKIKVIDPATDTITTLMGSSAGWADGTDPRFYEPGGIHAVDGRLYIADTNNHTVRIVDLDGLEAATLLLKGIERFTPAASDDDYRGSLVTLPATSIAPGAGVIELAIELPPGHKVNEDAPSSVEWIVSAGSATLGAEADRSLTGTSFPLEFPADFTASGTVTADVNLIWCANDAESLCFIEQVRIMAPFDVAAEAGNRLVLAHTIALPDLGA